MKNCFIAAKYENKWSVYDRVSRTFSHIGKGKLFCEKKAKELNDGLVKAFDDPIFSWITAESAKRMSEVVRDVFPNATKEEICDYLSKYWEKDDSPEDLYKRLSDLKASINDGKA